ncbi:3-hydroxyacyl-ACP dehydratase FabZ [Lysinibacillus boronitolerans]|uniref:3-hydroxyacyl-ACP dehydratase FabZ n=1 Tax=Lysinibacillus boronitolerans TaxID=309788 RepID=UPI0021623DEA|nr:3-hydroxyacyl-ACP dehydratase FabZ [Lysinibacillus boronitolerans]MCS1391367.1 3-hydroxyacyl-ACP dehydratase FabZ [Lysinibacillus boronitolerans]
MLNVQDIRKALPHRYPFLMVDKIVEFEQNQRVVGYKNVSLNEPWVSGHFPDEPIFPGVLILETMAQIGGFAFWSPNSKDGQLRGYISGMDKIKFVHPVYPGDKLMIEATVTAKYNQHAQVKCEAKVDEKLVAKSVISYVFK